MTAEGTPSCISGDWDDARTSTSNHECAGPGTHEFPPSSGHSIIVSSDFLKCCTNGGVSTCVKLGTDSNCADCGNVCSSPNSNPSFTGRCDASPSTANKFFCRDVTEHGPCTRNANCAPEHVCDPSTNTCHVHDCDTNGDSDCSSFTADCDQTIQFADECSSPHPGSNPILCAETKIAAIHSQFVRVCVDRCNDPAHCGVQGCTLGDCANTRECGPALSSGCSCPGDCTKPFIPGNWFGGFFNDALSGDDIDGRRRCPQNVSSCP